jgi:hypothetical protein
MGACSTVGALSASVSASSITAANSACGTHSVDFREHSVELGGWLMLYQLCHTSVHILAVYLGEGPLPRPLLAV